MWYVISWAEPSELYSAANFPASSSCVAFWGTKGVRKMQQAWWVYCSTGDSRQLVQSALHSAAVGQGCLFVRT